MGLSNILKFPRRQRDPETAESDEKPPPRAAASVAAVNPVTALGTELESFGRDYATTATILTESQRDKEHLERYAFARIDALYRPFRPETNPRDRQLIDRIKLRLGLRPEIEDDDTREVTLRGQLEKALPPEPGAHTVSTVVIATAVTVYALGNGASVFPLFAREFEDDPVLAWGLSLLIGAAIGALIVWSLLGLEEEETKK